MARQVCTNCSIASASPGTYSIKVLIGDGNCVVCNANSPAGDHNEEYTYRPPTTENGHFPFTDAQFCRLLALKGRMLDRIVAKHVPDEDGL